MSTCSVCKKELIKNPEPYRAYAKDDYCETICPDQGLPYHRQASSLLNYMENCPSDVLRHFMRSELENIIKTREPTID